MTIDELKKVYRRMLWVIPGMRLAMIGDYCMGIEPTDSIMKKSFNQTKKPEAVLRKAGFTEVRSDHYGSKPWITVPARKQEPAL